jgi:predicted ester cyclase
MSKTRSLLFSMSLLAGVVGTSVAGADEVLPQPAHVTVAQGMSADVAAKLLLPARRYYAFWNTGDAAYAKEALAETFTDLNLPAGRPQGPTGPLVASKIFRDAVPDLQVKVEQVWVVGDHVISQLRFTGHFTGHLGDKLGDGGAINFVAVDNYAIARGRIASNWHLEDNLTLVAAAWHCRAAVTATSLNKPITQRSKSCRLI